MPDHEDSLGGETFSGEEQQDPTEQSLGDGATMGGDTAAHSLGDQSTFGDANINDELFDDGMKLEDLSERYSEEGVLGKGGMGEVILATDTRLNRKVAIKRILGKAARSKTAVQRFLTEAQSIAALNHTNIVQIYDYGRATDGPFLIMECVQGGSLLEKCKAGPIEIDEAVNIFGQLCDGLAKAHAAGIIHRDIKPANVLMTEDGIPKLTDFGLAKDDTADAGMTIEGSVIGTLDFMPPEQRQGAEFTDHRSDLWSLAATFYQMLTGKSPKVINISSIPPKLQFVVAKSLEESKEERFQSAMEMRGEILNAHSGKMDTTRILAEGECPQCAVPNPAHGKFCVECGAGLQMQCLKCQMKIQKWNKACGECGSLQDPLAEKALADLKNARDQAERLLVDFEFEAAIEKAEVVASETDSRLQQYAEWRGEFIERLEQIRQAEYSRLAGQLKEAIAHEIANDFETDLQSLRQNAPAARQTPASGLSDTAVAQSERLATKQSRLQELEGIVRDRITKRDIAGLLAFVDEFLKLKPGRPEVQELKAQLEKREAHLDARNKLILEEAKDKASASIRKKVLVTMVIAAGGVVVGLITGVVIKINNNAKVAETAIANLDWETALAFDPSNADGLRMQADAEKVAAEQAEILARPPINNTIGMKLKLIPAGTFMMGSPEDEWSRGDDEHQHEVMISKSFYMQTTEVTQGQWKAVMGTGIAEWLEDLKEGPNYAASYVDWGDAVAYCKKLTAKEGKIYRLPTEAEWEYACRAGTTTIWSFGDGEYELGDYAWYDENAGDIGEEYPHQVGLKKSNAFGLYDMHGNVREWCQDFVLRDGSWFGHSYSTRSASSAEAPADNWGNVLGFRVVRELD